ncbi:SpoVK/Ycf46/Vps4 family AAA+-type ATPase [Flavobacterium sp. 28A]|uniref:ATP-binding protein n=1 Tax=Flavobacterium sp. 28A TaxID=2735895 RepID=UPI00156E95A3|nr:ATP-binding protein [Flavobacterium sp. 28A]NRT16959.1 SpoVK/Ycf46/Vps4 family AAA+-type ATPase [Flavobacterium sp. 28A]
METTEMTILKAVETIHKTSEKSKLILDRYDALSFEIQYISNYFQINDIQSILLSSFISLSCFDEIELKELITYFGLEKIGFLPYLNDIQYLVDKNILNKEKHRNVLQEDYSVKKDLLEFLVSNKNIPSELISIQLIDDTFHVFLKDLDVLSDAKDNKEIQYHIFAYRFKKLLKDNRKFPLINYACENLEPIDSFVFFDAVLDAISIGDNDFNTAFQKTVDDFTKSKSDTFDYVSSFLLGKTKLNTLNLVEKDKSEFANRHKIQLSSKAVRMLSEMEGISFVQKESKNDKLIYPDKIQKTNLFYNPLEQQLLEPVVKSMSQIAFSNLQKRLKANNMPVGVSSLLYGAPGTGKTETVYQIAKKYNRPIYKVEISETKSMWFGESQKLVKKIFTDYYELKEQEKICPILLFNEADAIIGKRKMAGSSSVSDTENAIQNVLLEDLENFDGILFATSNLFNNLDPAFERRFLFKIKFDTPSVDNAAKIWKNKLPSITTKEASYLANNYKFSGGEMGNIARKCIMEEVVLGNKLTFEKIISFCNSEKWEKNTVATKIGF